MKAIALESKLHVQIFQNSTLNKQMMVLLGSIFIALCSQISIPIGPVPITMQTFAVSLIAVVFGARMGGMIIAAYLIEGACGIPVFANFSAGLPVLLGPTGGYLIGFLFSVVATGYLCERGWARSRTTVFFAALFGNSIILILGYLVLAFYIGSQNAYNYGIAPFLLIDLIKIIMLSIVAPSFWKQKIV